MNCFRLLPNIFKRSSQIILCFLLLALSGCSIKETHKQTQSIENVGVIKGQVRIISEQKGTVIVVRYIDQEGVPVRESQVVASSNGDFKFTVLPGPHYIAAFVDSNRDGNYQPTEHGNFYGYPTIINVAPLQTVSLETLVIEGPAPQPDNNIKEIDNLSAVWENIGEVVSLGDPRFVQENYSMGFWKPFDFLADAEGGLLFLQEYQQGKIPVIFVHGVLGGPPVWERVINSLDKKYFQPWVLYYPSGIRLDMISDYLTEAVTQIDNKHDFNKFYVVAHSMGGLVARSFVKKYVERSPDNEEKLGLVMTINSPMNGMTAAASGVEYSPIVIPSWRDVEPNSEFLKNLNEWNWPKEIPYHLVISYSEGESSDGVVPLQSQAQLKLQEESTRTYVFNNDHVGTLNDDDFLILFNSILAKRSD